MIELKCGSKTIGVDSIVIDPKTISASILYKSGIYTSIVHGSFWETRPYVLSEFFTVEDLSKYGLEITALVPSAG